MGVTVNRLAPDPIYPFTPFTTPFNWLGGGMGQTDTFDSKRLGDPKTNKLDSYYPSIDTAGIPWQESAG